MPLVALTDSRRGSQFSLRQILESKFSGKVVENYGTYTSRYMFGTKFSTIDLVVVHSSTFSALLTTSLVRT